MQQKTSRLRGLVPKERFELSRAHAHYALNVARLPVPPLRLANFYFILKAIFVNDFVSRVLFSSDNVIARQPASNDCTFFCFLFPFSCFLISPTPGRQQKIGQKLKRH